MLTLNSLFQSVFLPSYGLSEPLAASAWNIGMNGSGALAGMAGNLTTALPVILIDLPMGWVAGVIRGLTS